ncbi:MAG: PDZ domain-containing protein [Planctomycetota bacterium]
MNIGSLKTLSYLTSFGLLAGIGYIGVTFYKNGGYGSFFDVDRAGAILNGVRPPDPPKRAELQYGADITPAIVNFDWTGKPPKIEKVATEDDSNDLEPVQVAVFEILEVTGVIAEEENPGDSHCIVRFKDPNADPKDMFLDVGDTLPPPNDGVGVLRILGDGVEFSFAEPDREAEIVPLSAQTKGELIVSVDESQLVRRPSLVGRRAGAGLGSSVAPSQTELRNGQYYIGSEDAALFQDNFADILSKDVKTETYYDEDGKRAGLKLTEVREGSIASRHGAQTGDVVVSINGSPVNSEQEAIQFINGNSDKYDVWQVEIMNMGRTRTETYHSPDN